MSMKSLFVSAAIGLAGLSLSGCVYDGGPYYYEGPGYYGSGYYAGGGVIYDRGGYYRHRHHHRRHVSDGHQHRPPQPPRRPPQVEPPHPGKMPVVNRGDARRWQDRQTIILPDAGYPHN